jgi:ubiquinone/menaquinone biosynthesis C-methylase UbiE
MYKDSVLKYFADKASEYDLVENQSYWRLSDALLWDSIKTYIIPKLPKNFRFCDAGGGTGRWSQKLLQEFPECSGVTIDFSKEMLDVAKQKSAPYKGRWEFILQDLNDLSNIDQQFDFVFNFHNVIGFVGPDVDNFFEQLKSITKKGGIICTLAPNMYHAAFFNTKLGNIDEANKCLSGSGRFTDQMPYINMFSPDSIKNMMEKHNIKVDFCSGFPNLIYPGYQETQLRGQTGEIADILENEKIFKQIFDMEKQHIKNGDIAARGNNIFVFGTNN